MMAHNNGTDLNLLKFHIKEEGSSTTIKVEKVDEEIIKIETVDTDQNVDITELLANESRILELSGEELLNGNSGIKEETSEDDSKNWERINNLRTLKTADDNGTDWKWVDEEVIKTETEVCGGLRVPQTVHIKEPLAKLANVNENRHPEISTEHLLNENLGIEKKAFEDDSKTWERINNLSTNRQNDNENGLDFDGEEKVLQDNIANVKINNKEEEKLKFLHNDHDCLSTSTLKTSVLVSQKKDVVLNHTKGKKQKSKKRKHNGDDATEKKYKCNQCSYTAQQKAYLLAHIKVRHTIEKPHKCNECSYATVEKRCLLNHIKSRHTMEKPYKCNECSYATVEKRCLLDHIKSRHTMEKPYKCNECSYATVKKCGLLNHIKSRHTMEKPYKCNKCSYATVQKYGLLRHIRSLHTMEKPYKCNKCSYATKQKHNLLVHIESCHTMKKRYKCKECSYATAYKSVLVSHFKSRHMEKPYKCNKCSYATEQKHNLLVHIESCHTMKRRYKCKECSYTTAYKSVLVSHFKYHHIKEKHKCDDCSYAAVHQQDLRLHITSQHTMEKPYKRSECSYTAVRKFQLPAHTNDHHQATTKSNLIVHIKSRLNTILKQNL